MEFLIPALTFAAGYLIRKRQDRRLVTHGIHLVESATSLIREAGNNVEIARENLDRFRRGEPLLELKELSPGVDRK